MNECYVTVARCKPIHQVAPPYAASTAEYSEHKQPLAPVFCNIPIPRFLAHQENFIETRTVTFYVILLITCSSLRNVGLYSLAY